MVPILIFFLFNHNALLSISAHFHKGKEILIINTNLIFLKSTSPLPYIWSIPASVLIATILFIPETMSRVHAFFFGSPPPFFFWLRYDNINIYTYYTAAIWQHLLSYYDVIQIAFDTHTRFSPFFVFVIKYLCKYWLLFLRMISKVDCVDSCVIFSVGSGWRKEKKENTKTQTHSHAHAHTQTV